MGHDNKKKGQNPRRQGSELLLQGTDQDSAGNWICRGKRRPLRLCEERRNEAAGSREGEATIPGSRDCRKM